MFFIAYTFKGQVHVFAEQVKIVSHLSCRTSAILKYFCPLPNAIHYIIWNLTFYIHPLFVLFGFILYVPVNIFSVMSGRVSLGLNQY